MRLKKVKNALENIEKSTYYVNDKEEYCGKWKTAFENQNPIHVEIGMGKGDFVIQMAKQNPNINYIGIEMYDSVLVKAIKKLNNEEKISNLKLLLMDANHIEDVFHKEISRIYLNFSDPWPKKRHAKRRLTSSNFLKKYDIIFSGPREIFMKTDNSDLFNFSIESLIEHGYEIRYLTRNLYQDVPEGNVMTEYEKKFVSEGVPINRLEAYAKEILESSFHDAS